LFGGASAQALTANIQKYDNFQNNSRREANVSSAPQAPPEGRGKIVL
jgi:hypothetical protein